MYVVACVLCCSHLVVLIRGCKKVNKNHIFQFLGINVRELEEEKSVAVMERHTIHSAPSTTHKQL